MADPVAVTFRNAEGRQLFGTLHLPDARRADAPAVVLFSPGAKMRIGPGRLYVPLTDLANLLARWVGLLQQGRIAVYLMYSFVTLLATLVMVMQ